MNPHIEPRLTPAALLANLWTHRGLIISLTKREISGRYKGSALGIFWSLLTPLLMLGVFTVVFGDIFQARWGNNENTGRLDFATALFTGLLIYNFFAECLSKAPQIVLNQPNYVKKVVFPLEILAVVTINAALFHLLVAYVILLALALLSAWSLGVTALLAPFVFLPFLLLVLGLCWLLAALGVYLRDVAQITSPVLTALMFLSPVFFPMSAVPDNLLWLLNLNPLTFIVEQMRTVLLHGQTPYWQGLGIYLLIGMATAWIGLAFFQKTRKGFADVL